MKKYTFKCLKCDEEFSLQLTLHQYTNHIHRKHCSRSCANSRIQTKASNISRSIKLSLSDGERKKRRRISLKKAYLVQKNKRIQIKNLCGETCYLCGRLTSRMATHKISGKKHKSFDAMSLEELTTEIRSGKYIKLCYRCHKGIHFCMDILNMTWEDIIKLYKQV